MATSLADARLGIYDALEPLGYNTYRRRKTDFQYPAYVVGWPESMDVRAAQGDSRDYVINVFVEVVVTDDESADELLEDMIDGAITALLEVSGWDVQPATDFGEATSADGRVIIGCRLPVAVYA